jgi:hypothetical protein
MSSVVCSAGTVSAGLSHCRSFDCFRPFALSFCRAFHGYLSLLARLAVQQYLSP